MLQFLLTAPRSGEGKTMMTCALLAALQARGEEVCSFKCGPDYIDPMFHRAVLGAECHNLDLFLAREEVVRSLYARGCAHHTAAVCEGVMGYYDGLGGVRDTASAWHVADTLGLPALLVVRPKGQSLTLAAEMRGLDAFRTPSHLTGILLNDCSEKLYKLLAPMLERETGLPMLGYLPHLPEAAIPSRHLGLYTAGEIQDLQGKLTLLADTAQKTIDWARLFALCERPAPAVPPMPEQNVRSVRLAVARDEAFCFTYAETLEALEDAGAELCFFSPLRDAALPEGAAGLYLPGGYPELYAHQLSENETLLHEMREKIIAGLPTVAECGGFLALGQTLAGSDGVAWPMVGALPGQGTDAGHLVRFGYANLTARADSLLFRAGETLPVHEFHRWDSTENGTDFTAQKPLGGRSWACGVATPTLYAGFPHLYWAGTPLPGRFVAAARRYAERERNT